MPGVSPLVTLISLREISHYQWASLGGIVRARTGETSPVAVTGVMVPSVYIIYTYTYISVLMSRLVRACSLPRPRKVRAANS